MASPFVTGKGMSHFPNGQSMAMLDMCDISRKVTTPQDTHKRSVLQVYLGSNSSECSAICR